ncbi:MAG: hypothetical protein ACI9GW_000948 [Halieaceae bacterium]|jgi:hypothetical protein
MNRLASQFNASELSSRKLWELVSGIDEQIPARTELEEAVQELAERRHYLNELQQIGVQALHNK